LLPTRCLNCRVQCNISSGILQHRATFSKCLCLNKAAFYYPWKIDNSVWRLSSIMN
jgi:hypothetical protein